MNLQQFIDLGIQGKLESFKSDRELIRSIQIELVRLGYVLAIDGILGPNTLNTFIQFKKDMNLANPDIIGSGSAKSLLAAKSISIQIPSSFGRNETIIYRELRKGGLTPIQCAAVLGCWQQESSFNPYAKEPPPGTGLGLAQWSFGRRNKVPPFTGNVETDIKNQVALFFDELEGTEKKAGNALKTATTLNQAIYAMKLYERYGIAGNRELYARQIWDKLRCTL